MKKGRSEEHMDRRFRSMEIDEDVLEAFLLLRKRKGATVSHVVKAGDTCSDSQRPRSNG